MPRCVDHIVTLDCREVLIRRWRRTGPLTAQLESYDDYSGAVGFPLGIWGLRPCFAPLPSVFIDASAPRYDDLILSRDEFATRFPASAVPV